MREIPKKNYITLLIIVIVVIVSTLLLTNIYNNQIRKTSIMYEYLSEIKKNDIDTYLLEKPNMVLFVSNKYDTSNNKVEKRLKKVINEYNLKEYIVYLNINNNTKDYIDKINKKYNGKIKKELPVIIVFEDGKIKNAYYNLEKINLKEIIGEIK